MAIRYSGDVEIRMQYKGRDLYIASVRAPGEHILLAIRQRFLFKNAGESKAYDAIAEEALQQAMKHTELPAEFDTRGNPVVRRVFQSPCPVDDIDY
jgi:hypothetical protein